MFKKFWAWLTGLFKKKDTDSAIMINDKDALMINDNDKLIL